MPQPDLVIDNKGRKIYQRLKKEQYSLTLGSEIYLDALTLSQTVAKIGKPSTTVTFSIRVINDSDETASFILKKTELCPYSAIAWSSLVKEEGISKTLPLTISLGARLEKLYSLELTIPSSGISGQIGSVVLSLEDETNSDNSDICRGIVVLPFIVSTDIKKEAEYVTKDEMIFPSDAEYDIDDYLDNVIIEESSELLEYVLKGLDGVTFDKLELVKKYLVNKVMHRLLLKQCSYSISGTAFDIAKIELYKKESENLLKKLVYRYL